MDIRGRDVLKTMAAAGPGFSGSIHPFILTLIEEPADLMMLEGNNRPKDQRHPSGKWIWVKDRLTRLMEMLR